MIETLSVRLCTIALAMTAVSTAGCDDKPKSNDAKAAAPSDAKSGAAAEAKSEVEACGPAYAEALKKELLSYCAVSSQVSRLELAEAPWNPPPTDIPERLAVEMSPNVVKVGWSATVDAAGLGAALSQAREADAFGGKVATDWVLSIDGSTRRNELADAFRSLAMAGYGKGKIVFATKPTSPLPKPRDSARLAALAKTLADTDGSTKATLLAKEIQDVVGSCQAFEDAFGAVATVPADQRCTAMVKGISHAMVECRCPEQEDELVTLIYGVTVGTAVPEYLGHVTPVVIDSKAPSRPGETWAEVVAGLDEAALDGLWIAP
ncbi:MAG: hypothetical protein K0V04_11475 [Deltaproteobacteria bacterium]|nr:hypothetical protein [Deltaproteobacteria bacterium]